MILTFNLSWSFRVKGIKESWVCFGRWIVTCTFRHSPQTILMHIFYLIISNHGASLAFMANQRDTESMNRGSFFNTCMQDPHFHRSAQVTLMNHFIPQRSEVDFLNHWQLC